MRLLYSVYFPSLFRRRSVSVLNKMKTTMKIGIWTTRRHTSSSELYSTKYMNIFTARRCAHYMNIIFDGSIIYALYYIEYRLMEVTLVDNILALLGLFLFQYIVTRVFHMLCQLYTTTKKNSCWLFSSNLTTTCNNSGFLRSCFDRLILISKNNLKR